MAYNVQRSYKIALDVTADQPEPLHTHPMCPASVQDISVTMRYRGTLDDLEVSGAETQTSPLIQHFMRTEQQQQQPDATVSTTNDVSATTDFYGHHRQGRRDFPMCRTAAERGRSKHS